MPQNSFSPNSSLTPFTPFLPKDSQLDYSELKTALSSPTSYKLKDVEHKIVRLAYDVVRWVEPNSNIDGLWKVTQDESGQDIIVALYPEQPIEKTASTTSNWQVSADTTNLSISYKHQSVTKLSLASLNIVPSEAYLTVESLPSKLASEPALVKSLLGDLTPEHKNQLCINFPELSV